MKKEAVIGLAAAGVAVGGILIAAVARAAPAAPAAAPPGAGHSPSAPWSLVQGHRYQVTLRVPSGSTWAGFDPRAMPPGWVFVQSASPSAYTYTYQFDYVGPSGDAPAALFWLFPGPTPADLDFVVADLGPTANIAMGSTAPAPRPGGSNAWQPATSVPFAGRVRWSMTAADVTSFAVAQQTGFPGGAAATPANIRHILEALLGTGKGGARLQTRVYFVWEPGEALPTDWPTDDQTLSAGGYHVEMIYGIGYAVQALPIGAMNAPDLTSGDLAALGITTQGMWTLAGSGATGATALPAQPGISWALQPNVAMAAHVRISNLMPVSKLPITQGFAAFGDAARLTWYAYAHAAALAFGGVPMLAWWVGDPVPPDWPSDDPAPATEPHLEFRSGIAHDFTSDPNVRVWLAQGPGA